MSAVVDYSVIIVAGGKGIRAGGGTPKQFEYLVNKPMLMHVINAFYDYGTHLRIVVVLPSGYIDYWENLCKEYDFKIPHTIVQGGETRFHSVKKGLQKIPNYGVVAIHDGARPFVTPVLIKRCFDAATKHNKGVIPVVDEVNSLRMLTHNGSKSIDRKQIKIVQTPQVFPAKELKEAYDTAFDPLFTDDASVAERHGIPIILVSGEESNHKITTSTDLMIASYHLAKR